jgi:hypothetical protein
MARIAPLASPARETLIKSKGVFISRLTQIYADFLRGIAADFPIAALRQVVHAMRSKSTATGYGGSSVSRKSIPVSLPKNLRKSALICG